MHCHKTAEHADTRLHVPRRRRLKYHVSGKHPGNWVWCCIDWLPRGWRSLKFVSRARFWRKTRITSATCCDVFSGLCPGWISVQSDLMNLIISLSLLSLRSEFWWFPRHYYNLFNPLVYIFTKQSHSECSQSFAWHTGFCFGQVDVQPLEKGLSKHFIDDIQFIIHQEKQRCTTYYMAMNGAFQSL